MQYSIRLYIAHLPNVLTETRIIDGKEQTCLILPVDDNQFRKGKKGNYFLSLRMMEEPANPQGHSHTIALRWNNKEGLEEAHRRGIDKYTRKMGVARAYETSRVTEVHDQNNVEDIEFVGEIILSDIPRRQFWRNRRNNKWYIPYLQMKSRYDDSKVWTGSICISDIPENHILEYPDSGKKYVKVRFRKMDKLDIYMNTHTLIIDTKDGSQIEIGRFREWKKQGEVIRNEIPPQEIHDTPVNQRTPESIDGLRF